MGRYRIGVDIGGTFTDFSVYDATTRETSGLKVPTVPHDPVAGLLDGLRALSAERGVHGEEIDYFVHGTTIAVNTLIERRGAPLAMLVTKGFRDLLLIQRLAVPRPQYWWGDRATPLIPRELVFEIDERLHADGSVERPVSTRDVRAAVMAARRAGVAGIVVCFLHAFRNPAHELATRRIVERAAPELFVCCSAEVWPRMREYERAVITSINAYVTPRIDGYLGKLETTLAAHGMRCTPHITQSNGGVVTARRAREKPAETLLSGPASGVIGAVHVARDAGIDDIVTLDIGGTSADVAFVNDGRPEISQSEHVADFPIMMPVIGVSSIGAGGGSFAWLDGAGVLRIGPESAGSDPGPACYGKGNLRPTLTDAFLAGGYLNPSTFAGGRVALHPELAERAIGTLATGLGTTLGGAVDGVFRVTLASLYAELSNVAAQKGLDVRGYTLVAFGGAGALVACRLADEIGVARVLVPPAPGTLCAMGALAADVAGNFVRSLMLAIDGSADALRDAYRDLEREARDWLAREAPSLASHAITLSADMRYVGQSFEIDVALDPRWIVDRDLAALGAAFHEAHRRLYFHADETVPVEIVDLRLLISGTMPKPTTPAVAAGRGAAPSGERLVVTRASAPEKVPVWRRADLGAGDRVHGPALVDQDDTTTFVPSGWRGEVHAGGSLILRRDV